MDHPVSRREFLKTSGIVAGSLATGCTFTSCSSTSLPPLYETINPVAYPKLPGHKIQALENGCLTGIWMGGIVDYRIKEYEEMVGQKPSFIFIPYLYQTHISIGFNAIGEMESAARLGVIPFISYDARDFDISRSILTDIYEGHYDKNLVKTAKKLKDFSDRMLVEGHNPGFFIRTMREINGGYWSWSGSANKFKQAWKHIHSQ